MRLSSLGWGSVPSPAANEKHALARDLSVQSAFQTGPSEAATESPTLTC